MNCQGRICWVEIVTMSTYDEERKRINQKRNKKIFDDNSIREFSFSWAIEERKEQLGKILKNKFSKQYSRFAQLKQATQ
jgi:hypothetical protein